MPARITLVGYRASGKSTLGPQLAGRLGVPFLDADRVLEGQLGCSIAELFAAHGEAVFREREADCLAGLLAGDGPMVLATGGGAVLREGNRKLLRGRGGLVCYLAADAAILAARLRRSPGGRPPLSGAAHPADEVAGILAVREPLYREVAGLVLDAGLPPGELIAAILARMP